MNNIDYIHNQDYQLRDNILVECSQEKAINSNYVYDWTCETGEINIKMGDEIMIYQSFLNVKGASNESINILDEEINGNNPAKTPIEIQYYKCNDGLNSLPMPYSFQLLSMGTEEPNIDNINRVFYSNLGTNSNCLGSGMFVGTDCKRNIMDLSNKPMILADFLKPIDCSRYTLMEQYIDEDAVYNETPRIKHRIFTGTHTINLESNYYTPSNLCDNITKSITNPTLNNTIDEFDREIGIDITTPTMIKHKGLYRSRLDYGGLGTNDLFNSYITGSYLPKSVWGWDIVIGTDDGAGGLAFKWKFNEDSAGTDETDVKNGFPRVSEDWFSPSPSWDFYGGTDRFEIGTSYQSATGTLSAHTNYYYKYPNTLIAGEKLWNKPIRQAISLGSVGTIQTGFAYNTDNITRVHNLVNTALEEGAYDNIVVRNYNQSLSGTSQITLNKLTQRAISISQVNPNNIIFGTAGSNTYYGFPTNKRGHNFGCDFAGFGSFTANYEGSNCWQLQENGHSSKFKSATQNTLGSFVSNIQLIKYDPTNIEGSGVCVNSSGYIGFVVGSEEGGFVDTISIGTTHHIGWFPKHTDGLFNSAICHINPNGLGYKPFNRKIEGRITGTITTQIQPLRITGTTEGDLFPRNISYGSDLGYPKSHASSNPNVYVGAIKPLFSFDTDLSRFTITNLHTPQYINNSVYASTGVPLTDAGSSVVYLNPVFQETQNTFIGKWENWGTDNVRKPMGLKTYFNNADRNRNTFKKGVSIMDAKMGIYISKWAKNDTEDAWDNTLWSKMGFSYETLHPPNNRHFRNEDYTIGTTITLSNPSTTNANFDVSLMNQLTTNMWSYPLYTIGACGEVLQREISAPSSEIVADKLPIKNELPYYIICSDILSYGGGAQYRQGGNTLPAIDICSLNYNSEDYYFAEPSQLTHIADKDLNIHSVNIVVRRPDGRLATELSGKSSVIIKISRNKMLPAIAMMEDIGDKLEELDKNTMALPPQISGGKLSSSGGGGSLMGAKITTDTINNFRTLTNLGIMGETMEALQGLSPERYTAMIEQERNNEIREQELFEEIGRLNANNTIIEAQIRSNTDTLRSYELEIQRNFEERQMIPRLREQVRTQELEEDYNRNVERLNRIYEEMPNLPSTPLPTNNLPSTPNLSTNILYQELNEDIDDIDEGELSPSQVPLPAQEPFNQAVERSQPPNVLNNIENILSPEQQEDRQRIREVLRDTPVGFERAELRSQLLRTTDALRRLGQEPQFDREPDTEPQLRFPSVPRESPARERRYSEPLRLPSVPRTTSTELQQRVETLRRQTENQPQLQQTEEDTRRRLDL